MNQDLKSLCLIFPEWQGSGNTNELYYGAQRIHKRLSNLQRLNSMSHIIEVPVNSQSQLVLHNNIWGYADIVEQLKAANGLIAESMPDAVFTIGGSCGTELVPVSYLNKRYKGDLAIVWLDAHGDLNTPASSPSKLFHGMPLRTLLGDGDPEVCKLTFSQVKLEQVFLIGARDLDPPESAYIAEKRLFMIEPSKAAETLETLLTAIRTAGFSNIYIHLDLDVLDPTEFPCVKCPTSNGIKIKQLLEMLKRLTLGFHQVGFSIVEYVPNGDKDLNIVEQIVQAGLSFAK